MDHGLARVKVDRRTRQGERIDAFRVQRRIDRCQPTALAVPDQVDPAAAVPNGAIHHLEVVIDGGGCGRGSGADPVERQSPGQPGAQDRAHLALLRRVVDDARRVSRLRGKHQRGDQPAGPRGREIPQARDRRFEDDLVRTRPRGRPPRRGQLKPARNVEGVDPPGEGRHHALRKTIGRGAPPIQPAGDQRRGRVPWLDRRALRDSVHGSPIEAKSTDGFATGALALEERVYFRRFTSGGCGPPSRTSRQPRGRSPSARRSAS